MFFKKKVINPERSLEMLDKSLHMLEERYKHKSISIDEFSKKCTKIGKERAKLEKIIKKRDNL